MIANRTTGINYQFSNIKSLNKRSYASTTKHYSSLQVAKLSCRNGRFTTELTLWGDGINVRNSSHNYFIYTVITSEWVIFRCGD